MSATPPSSHTTAKPVLLTRPFDHPHASELLQAYAVERRQITKLDDPPGLDQPHHFAPPSGVFLVAYSPEGAPIACGGFRSYPKRTGVVEVRKMFVAATARRCGLGRRVLAELERLATLCGASEVILETGSYNDAALRLYTSAGYFRTAPYVSGRPSFNRAFAKKVG